jgi:hypothetical protein
LGQKKSCVLKDHVAAAYYAPSIGWSFSLSCEWSAFGATQSATQPPSQ